MYLGEFDSLVLATTNRAEDGLRKALHESLAGEDLEIHAIGDCVAPRTAGMAFFEARRLALDL